VIHLVLVPNNIRQPSKLKVLQQYSTSNELLWLTH
jgi:hypothetical protein